MTVLAALAALLAIPATAFAYAPTGDDFITCVAGGDENIECVAGIFDANTECTWETSTGANGSGTSDGEGEFAFDFDAPSEEGSIQATVQCGSKVLSDTVANVTAEGDVIANAGLDSMALLGIGAGALAIGAGVLAISRRRSNA